MDEDNVIYVQVDEHGRVINYTSNNAIGDQLILLQEGQDGQVVVPTQHGTALPTTSQQVAQHAPQPSVQPAAGKPTIINLGAGVSSLPSGVQLMGAAKSASQNSQGLNEEAVHLQVHAGVRVAPSLPSTMSHLSPVHTMAAPSATPTRLTLSPQKVTLSPQKLAISPQKVTINPQKITISPQKIGAVISGASLGSSVGQIRFASPQQKLSTQSILTPSGMKQVSLLGSVPRPQSKITIKSVSPKPSTQVERISLDQLMSSGGVTLQKISAAPQIAGLSSTLVTAVNSTTENLGNTTSPGASQQVTSQVRSGLIVTQHEDVAYVKPDTTTDEATLPSYQAPEPQVAVSENLQVSAASQVTSGSGRVSTENNQMSDDVMMTPNTDENQTSNVEEVLENKNYVSDLCVMSQQSSAVDITMDTEGDEKSTSKIADEPESLDETLENYLAGDSNIASLVTTGHTVAGKPEQSMDTDEKVDEDEKNEEGPATETEAAQSDEDDDFDDGLPAGLIRGEPIHRSSAQKSAEELVPEKEPSLPKQAGNDSLLPEVDTTPRKRSRLPLAVQSASDTEGTDNESMPLLQSELIPSATDVTAESDTAPVLVRSTSGQRKGHKKGKVVPAKEAPEEKGKKDFMKKNFNLFTPREIEDKKSKRRSARVSNAEQLKQADAEIENQINSKELLTGENEAKSKEPGTSKMMKQQTDRPTCDSNTDLEQSRQNIFDIFGSNKEGSSPTDDPKKYISKLQSVNTELKSRIRHMEQRLGKSPHSKNREKAQVKMLESKLARFEKINEELLLKLQEYEGKENSGKPSPPERKVDTVYKHGKLTFSPSGSSTKRDPLRWEKFEFGSEEKQDVAAFQRKERKLKALHQELDQRTAILKSKESKLQRLVNEVKERENKVEYREQAIQRRVQDIEYRERILEGKTKAAIEKRNKQGGSTSQEADDLRSKELIRFEMEQKEKEIKRREAEVTKREQEAKKKEELLKVTEKQLQQLHNELKQEYEQKHDTARESSRQIAGTPTTSLAAVTTPKADGRGRPRKVTEEALTSSIDSDRQSRSFQKSPLRSPLRKDGRGRPRKYPLSPWSPTKRKDGRGRPRIYPLSSVSSEKQTRDPARTEKAAEADGNGGVPEMSKSTAQDRPGRLRKPLKPKRIVRKDSKTVVETPDESLKSSEAGDEGRRTSRKNRTQDDIKSDLKPEEVTSPGGRSASRGRARKTPKSDKPVSSVSSEIMGNDGEQTPKTSRKVLRQTLGDDKGKTPKDISNDESNNSTESRREIRRTRKSTTEAVKLPSVYERDPRIEDVESETKEGDKTEPKADDYDFESDTEQAAVATPRGMSGSKADSLKKPLKWTRKPHGAAAVLRKRSRSHSQSPAPSEPKKLKSA